MIDDAPETNDLLRAEVKFLRERLTRTEESLRVLAGAKRSCLADEVAQQPAIDYRSLFENNDAPMLLIDPETAAILDTNAAASVLYGWSREELLSRRITDINILPEDEVVSVMGQLKVQARRFLFRHRVASGRVIDVEVYSTPLAWDGRICLCSIIHDISDRVRAEREAAKSRQLLQDIIDNVPAFVSVKDREGKLTLVNRRYEEFFKLPEKALLGLTLYDLLLPALAEQHQAADLAAFTNCDTRTLEETLDHVDGRHTYLTLKFPLRDDNGAITAVGSVSTDITDRKRIEEALKAKGENLRRFASETALDRTQLDVMLSNQSQGVILFDRDGKVVRLNQAAVELFGFSKPEESPMCIGDFDVQFESTSPEGQPLQLAESPAARALQGDHVIDCEIRISRRDTGTHWIGAFSAVPVRDSDGRVVQALVTITNITAHKRSESALEERLTALTGPRENTSDIRFQDLFDLEEIQKIQDAFAAVTGVASIITTPQGEPLTQPSNFCHLCRNIIRQSEQGLANCYHSDAVLGRMNPDGPIMQPCLSGGLWDGGASIQIGDRHIANWLIGQVLDESFDLESMVDYAREIGADEVAYRQALKDVTRMSRDQFGKVCQALYLIAGQLSRLALRNVQQARHITEWKQQKTAQS